MKESRWRPPTNQTGRASILPSRSPKKHSAPCSPPPPTKEPSCPKSRRAAASSRELQRRETSQFKIGLAHGGPVPQPTHAADQYCRKSGVADIRRPPPRN